MGTKLVTNRNITVTSKSGSSINFEKGVPTHVPDHAIEDCMSAGAIPAKGEKVAAHAEPSQVEDAPQGVERKQRILDAIDTMVVLNERGKFNANGAPKQNFLEKTAGFVVDTREIETLWHEFDAARKADTQVDAGTVATVNDPRPIVTEHDEGNSDDQDKVESDETAEESVGEAATKVAEAPEQSSEAAPEVETSRIDMMGHLKATGVAFPGNISNAKLKELYDASPVNSAG